MKKNFWASIIMKSCAIILFIISVFLVENVFADDVIADDGIDIVYGQNQFLKLVYEDMLDRKDTIEIRYIGEDYLEVFDLFEKEKFLDKVAELDDPYTSDDFDYLGNNLSKMKTSIKYSNSKEAVFLIQIEWRETYEQTLAVNEKVKELIAELNLEDKTTYEKIKMTHDYIVDNVEYDTECIRENAYTALFEGSSTCQGYSLLFYKIMTELGVNCRYITGTGVSEENGPHGWNIVQIGSYWYNIDVTWDDPVYVNSGNQNIETKISYDFFLKGNGDFDDTHIRDNEFRTGSFMSEYPMSNTDYDKDTKENADTVKSGLKPLTWKFTEQEINGAEGLYRRVVITDLSTYKNIFPNIVQGFGNVFSENGFFATIGVAWKEMTVINRIVIILFLLVVIANVVYKFIAIDENKIVN